MLLQASLCGDRFRARKTMESEADVEVRRVNGPINKPNAVTLTMHSLPAGPKRFLRYKTSVRKTQSAI